MLPGFFNAVFPRQLDMAGVDDTACRMEEGLFNDSLELLDIAGPVAAVEKFHGLVGKRLCRHAVTGRHFRKDMVGNDFHIFHPLPQGRYPDDGANDQFIEALGKEAFIGQTFQVGVTGRNDADIEFPANACLLVENTVFKASAKTSPSFVGNFSTSSRKSVPPLASSKLPAARWPVPSVLPKILLPVPLPVLRDRAP